MPSLTDTYRKQNLALRAATIRDLMRLWPALDWAKLDSTYPAWYNAIAILVQRDRRTAAGLASAYLQAMRMQSGVPGSPVIKLVTGMDAEQLATSVRVTSVVAAKRSAAAGKTARQAMADAFVLSSGAVTDAVLDAGRQTIMESTYADPKAAGWQRVTSGGCAFCAMLADRGGVYSESGADFASHNHCGCSAEPVYGDASNRQVRDYTPSLREASDADRERVRAWLKDHPQ